MEEAGKTRRHGPLHAALENKSGTPSKTTGGSMVGKWDAAMAL